MAHKYWKISPESGEYAVTVEALDDAFRCGEPIKAFVKWDGCTQILWEEGAEGYTHPCDLPQFIESMQELLEISNEYFVDRYPMRKQND